VDVIPNAPAELDRTVASAPIVSYPTLGRPVSRDDWYLLWGPLGMLALLSVVIVGILWRRLIFEREQALTRAKEDAAKLDAEHKAMRELMEAHAEKLEELGREHAGQFQATTEKLHTLAVSLRDALDATSRRVIR
jgi:hypothetical protein